jgi:hypothetical protein
MDDALVLAREELPSLLEYPWLRMPSPYCRPTKVATGTRWDRDSDEYIVA